MNDILLGNGVIYENKVWYPKEGYILRFVSDLLPRLLPRSAGHMLKVTSFNLYTRPVTAWK
jgi:hypothetical protein